MTGAEKPTGPLAGGAVGNAPIRDRVAIVMATCQGAPFLDDQLRSIAAQTHLHWSLIASDDGSTDGTLDDLEDFRQRHPEKVRIVSGPRRGFAANFLYALRAAPDAEYYAFCDQDDMWEPDKLERALNVLGKVPAQRPALYCGRTLIVDERGRPLGMSPAFNRPPAFANALVQSIAGGNTMVMNQSAQRLMVAAGVDLDVVSHDWWAYQLVSGAGGIVHYDREPSIKYRQHGANLVGVNTSFRARANRLRWLWQGRFTAWSDRNIAALTACQHLLTAANREMLERFVAVRRLPFPARLVALRRSGIYRQTSAGTLSLLIAALLGKI